MLLDRRCCSATRCCSTALGYALATAIFFWLASWLLGSERPARDALVGLVLGVVTSYAFTQWLNVQLPTGPWGV